MTTTVLYEFLVLARTLNFSRAAENLFISQSSLSRHMRELEAELHVQLMERSTHAFRLTPAGQTLAAQAGRLIKQCDNAMKLVHMPDLPTAGRVAVACSPEIAHSSHVRVFVGRFTEQYPDIEVQLDILPSGMSFSAVEKYDAAFSFCDYGTDAPGLSRFSIAEHKAYLAVAASHRLSARSIVSLSELAGETLLVPFADEMFGPYARNWKLTEKATRGRVRCRPVPNVQTALFLASIGSGVALIPGYAKHILIGDTFVLGIRDPGCCFHEFLYLNAEKGNRAAALFYEKFCQTFDRA